MKVKAPPMRMRRVPPSTTLDHPLSHSPIPQPRRFDTPPISHSLPLHELESLDVEHSRQSPPEPRHDAIGFGDVIQRARGDKKEREGDDRKKRQTDDKREKEEKKEKKEKRSDSRDRRSRDTRRRHSIKMEKKKEEPEESNKRKRESRSSDSSTENDPTRFKMKRTGSKDNVERKPVGRKPNRNKSKKKKEDDNDEWNPKNYHKVTGRPLKNTRKKPETLNDIFDDLKTHRMIKLPPKYDFYDQFFAHEDTGPLLHTLSDEAMEEYESRLTDLVTTRKLEEQSKYIANSLHTNTELEDPEKYYDTGFDQQALALRELTKPKTIDKKKKKKKEDLPPEESLTLWRQPVPSIRYQPKGSLVTSFDSEGDYNSITKKLQSGVSNKEITPLQIGTSLNQPTPKKVRENLETIEPLKSKKRTNRDNYRDEEEMPSTMNYVYNLAYTDRGVEQKRNRAVGPYQGVRNTLVSNKSFSLDDAFSKFGKGGMVTYPGSGTSNSKKTKKQTEELIGLSMSQIELRNLRDTDLGTKDRRMSGTNRNLKHRGRSARNLAKAVGKEKGMKLRARTPSPPPLEQAKKEFKLNLMRDYGSINNRDIVEKKGKYSLIEGGPQDLSSEEDITEKKIEKKKIEKKEIEKKIEKKESGDKKSTMKKKEKK